MMGGRSGGVGSAKRAAISDAMADSMAEQLESRMTARERDALVGYGGSLFVAINQMHRNGHKDRQMREFLKRKSAHIDKLLAKAPRLPATTLFREFDSASLVSRLAVGNPKGFSFTEKGFASTSRTAGRVQNAGNSAVVMQIRVKAGTKGISMQKAGVRGEQEIVLSRGTRFRIRSAKQVAGKWHVVADAD